MPAAPAFRTKTSERTRVAVQLIGYAPAAVPGCGPRRMLATSAATRVHPTSLPGTAAVMAPFTSQAAVRGARREAGREIETKIEAKIETKIESSLIATPTYFEFSEHFLGKSKLGTNPEVAECEDKRFGC